MLNVMLSCFLPHINFKNHLDGENLTFPEQLLKYKIRIKNQWGQWVVCSSIQMYEESKSKEEKICCIGYFKLYPAVKNPHWAL